MKSDSGIVWHEGRDYGILEPGGSLRLFCFFHFNFFIYRCSLNVGAVDLLHFAPFSSHLENMSVTHVLHLVMDIGNNSNAKKKNNLSLGAAG
jgi:hypothetical protein